MKTNQAMKDNYSPPPPGLRSGARVWCYLRDSGGNSQDRSVAQQESEIRVYCDQYKLHLVRVYRDIAKSGSSTVKRDDFLQMIDDSENEIQRPDAILIWEYARFARNLRHAQLYKNQLRENGIIIHSITDHVSYDEEGIWQVIEYLKDWSNEQENRRKSRNVKRGLKDLVNMRKASQPGKLGGFAPGTPAKGYKSVPVCVGHFRNGKPHYVSRWEPDPVLIEYVKIAWELRAAGKSYAEITKATKGKLYTSAASWNVFFRNRSYLGYYGKGEREIPDHHEPLINQDVWEAVQRMNESHPLQERGGFRHPRRVGNPTLLSGFTFCLECGGAMTHSPGHKRKPWRHYLCGMKCNHGYNACNSRRVGADKAETKIIEAVLSKILTPGYLSDALEETRRRINSTADAERQMTAEKRRLEDLDIAIQRLLRTIERTESTAAQDWLKEREIEREQVKAEIERLSLQLAASQLEITPAAMVIILNAWRDQFNKLQEAGNIREIKDFLMHFITRIELGYNRAKIYYTYPMTDMLGTPSKPRFTSSSFGGTGRVITTMALFIFQTGAPAGGMLFESPWGHKRKVTVMVTFCFQTYSPTSNLLMCGNCLREACSPRSITSGIFSTSNMETAPSNSGMMGKISAWCARL